MSSREQAAKKLHKIPKRSRKKKWQLTLVGIVLIVVGLAMPKFLNFPWHVGTATFGYGCFLISKDLLIGYLRFIPAAIRDIYDAVKGR